MAGDLLNRRVGEWGFVGSSQAAVSDLSALTGVRIQSRMESANVEVFGEFATLEDALLAVFPDAELVERDGVVVVAAQGQGQERWTGYGAVRSEDAAEVAQSVYGLKAHAVGDRVSVSGERSEVRSFAEWLEGEVRDYWLVEVIVIRQGFDWYAEAGLDVTASLGYTGRVGVEDLSRWLLEISATGRAEAQRSRSSVEYSAAVIAVEGEQVSLHSGQVVPIARRQVTEFGSVQVVGYEDRRVGITIDARVRRVGDGAVLDLEPSISAAGAVVPGEPPVIDESRVSVSVPVVGDDFVVVSGLSIGDESRAVRILGGAAREGRQEFRVLARAIRVYAGG